MFKQCTEAQELGRSAESLLTEWRQDALSCFQTNSCKQDIQEEIQCRHPSLRPKLITEEWLAQSDLSFEGLVEQFYKLIKTKR